MSRYTVQELLETAEEYYRRIPDPSPLMSKPFAFWHETPQMLQDLGALLSGMHLGKGMTVLDFGGGTGWLSRILAQLNCQTICCDVSRTALEIGRRLFDDYPLIGTAPYKPTFLQFDGFHLQLPDDAVDRIVCFDAFHHVPNPAVVIGEFARVLRPGGIAGFSEPGIRHSEDPQSQYEMHHHRVLENDIDLNDIDRMARDAGFTAVTAKVLVDRELSLEQYGGVVTNEAGRELRDELWNDIRATMVNRNVFFLHHGTRVRDSRSHEGLSHRLTLLSAPSSVRAGDPIEVIVEATNTGDATWLHEGDQIFGVVRLGSHLYDAAGVLVLLDHSRHGLPRRVGPSDTVTVAASLRVDTPGVYRIELDLVAEGVAWFENVGSTTVSFEVAIETT